MAIKTELHIEITPDGEVKVTVKGASGGACLELTKALENELGVVVERQMTSAFYEMEANVGETVHVGEPGADDGES